jgi:PAS domain S-box-containing protein
MLSGCGAALAAAAMLAGADALGLGGLFGYKTLPGVIGLGMIGAILIAVELGHRRAAWLGLLPALLGLFSLCETAGWTGWSVEAAIGAWVTGDKAGPVETMPVVVAAALCVLGVLLPWLARSHREDSCLPFVSVVASVLGAIGIAALFGHALSMPGSRSWSAIAGLPPILALGLLGLGGSLLAFALAGHARRHIPGPVWLPLPVIIGCGTLTVVIWAGLREREDVYLGANAQIAINNFAGNINLEFERQTASLERMARRWDTGGTLASWEADASTWMDDAPGANALALVARDGATAWYYPRAGNENLIAFRQTDDPVRRAAILSVGRSGAPAATATLDIPGRGRGFVIYAPVYRDGILSHFLAAEFTYQRFMDVMDRRLKLAPFHRCAVYLGDDRVYSSTQLGPPSRESSRVLESVFTLQNRRLRVVMEPTEDFLANNRHFLPEISLAAGLGITCLLGLSVHFARTARAGLGAVEITNRRLRDENEERRRVEAMLKVSDERLRLALDATVIGIFEWDCRAGTIHFDNGLGNLLGLPDALGPSTPEEWQALIHPDDLPGYTQVMREQLGGGLLFTDPEYRVRTAGGQWRWIYMRAKTVSRAATGTPARIVGTLQDVTSRREAEQSLLSSQAVARKLSFVASRTDNLVLIITAAGSIEWINASFQRVLEYSMPEVNGLKLDSFTRGPETSAHAVRRIQVALARGEGISTDIVAYSKSGRQYHLDLEIQPVRDERGVLENFIAIGADITTRVETEKALRRAKTEADDASRAKSDFLASMSHEIRTPMNGVIGMTSLLLEGPLTPEQRDSVNTIRNSGETLLTIINDLLDFSKVESGKLDIEHRPFDLAACVEETLDLFAGQAADRGIELTHFIAPAVPAAVSGDVNRLRQVFSNLVNNAVKFTPAGRVDLLVDIAPADPARPPLLPGRILVSVTVTDTGIGIPPDRLDRLFKPFSQVDSSTNRKYGGTGLGLAICQRLCSLMGGDIGVRSQPGRGSTFAFTVQLEPGSGGLSRFVPPAELACGPVLCIDDHPVMLDRLAAFFGSAGLTVLRAASAEAARSRLDHCVPSLAVLDLGLPPTPETESLHATLSASGIPTVGMLEPGTSAEPEWASSPRFAAVSRPLRNQSLARALHALFPSAAPEPVVEPVGDSLDLSRLIPLRVLVVEDNAVNQRVALRFLERLGYRADAVTNGGDAIDQIDSHSYQLVLMDLQMPEMDGFEATRCIRRMLPAHRQPRIIALTANALQSDRDLCLAAGMDDFITKPVKLTDISEAIRRNFAPAQPGV